MSQPRPGYHFSPPAGWMNDPNGLVYHAGEYHLFYQWHPRLVADFMEMAWGHAVSKDLLRWTHLTAAIEADDLGAIWSGSAVEDRTNTSRLLPSGLGLAAIFTHHSLGGAERQSVAFSSDRGRTWSKFAGNPVLGDSSCREFRDPKVFWHEPTGRWIMIVGVKQRLYSSANLTRWALLGETGFTSECPDLFRLPIEGESETRWVDSLAGTDYVVGDFDGACFRPLGKPIRVDGGLDFYASQSWENAPAGRRVWIGWMDNWKYAREMPDFGARGFMTVPRELSLRRQADGELRLVQRPIRELESLRAETLATDASSLPAGRMLDGGDCLEIVATIRPGRSDRCGLKVKASPTQETRVGYDASSEMVFVDRTRAGLPLLADRSDTPLRLNGRLLTLRIFVDRASVETFFDDGAVVMSSQVISDPSATGVAWFTENGASGLESLTIHRIKRIG